jgi:segregation and condensation protein B
MDENQIKYFVEAALLAAGRPLNVDQLQKLFDDDAMPEKSQLRQAISSLLEDYEERGLTITEVASGYRIQVESGMAERLQKLWEERPPRYSRAMFETLALIAYRQPMTRGEIEEIRGVSVSTNIIRSLLEREWVRIVGHRDVPGRPEMFGTTRQFLDYFGLKKLDDLPPLADLADWESLRVQLNLPAVEEDEAGELPEEGQELQEPSAATDIPVLSLEETDAESSDDQIASLDDTNLEPIEAIEWPDPDQADTVVQVLDVDQDETYVPVLDTDAEDDADDREDADASLTGA